MIRSPMSMNAALRPETYTAASAALGRRGTVVSRLTRFSVALVLRSRVGPDEDDRDGLLVVELRLAGGRDAVQVAHVVVDALRRALIAIHVDDDRDRAVEAGAEALRKQVVRPPGRLLLGLRALVGRTEPDEPRARCEDDPAARSTTKTGLWCRVTKRPAR